MHDNGCAFALRDGRRRMHVTLLGIRLRLAAAFLTAIAPTPAATSPATSSATFAFFAAIDRTSLQRRFGGRLLARFLRHRFRCARLFRFERLLGARLVA